MDSSIEQMFESVEDAARFGGEVAMMMRSSAPSRGGGGGRVPAGPGQTDLRPGSDGAQGRGRGPGSAG